MSKRTAEVSLQHQRQRTGQAVAWLATRLVGGVLALALLIAALLPAAGPAQQLAQPQLSQSGLPTSSYVVGAETVEVTIDHVANYQGCNWTGMCSVKFTRWESQIIVAGGSGLVASFLGGPGVGAWVGGAIGAVTEAVTSSPVCLQLNWNRYSLNTPYKMIFFTTFRC